MFFFTIYQKNTLALRRFNLKLAMFKFIHKKMFFVLEVIQYRQKETP